MEIWFMNGLLRHNDSVQVDGVLNESVSLFRISHRKQMGNQLFGTIRCGQLLLDFLALKAPMRLEVINKVHFGVQKLFIISINKCVRFGNCSWNANLKL